MLEHTDILYNYMTLQLKMCTSLLSDSLQEKTKAAAADGLFLPADQLSVFYFSAVVGIKFSKVKISTETIKKVTFWQEPGERKSDFFLDLPSIAVRMSITRGFF